MTWHFPLPVSIYRRLLAGLGLALFLLVPVQAAELVVEVSDLNVGHPVEPLAEDLAVDAIAEVSYSPFPGNVLLNPPYSYGVGSAKAEPADPAGSPLTLTLGGEIRAAVQDGDPADWSVEAFSLDNAITVAGGTRAILPRLLLEAEYDFTQGDRDERGPQIIQAILSVSVRDTLGVGGSHRLRAQKTISSTSGNTVNRWVVSDSTRTLHRGDPGDIEPIEYDGSALGLGKFTLEDNPAPTGGVVSPGTLFPNRFNLAWTVPPIDLPAPGAYAVSISLRLEVSVGEEYNDGRETSLALRAVDGLTFDTETPIEAPPGYLLNSPDLNIVNNMFPKPPVAIFDVIVPLLPLLLEEGP